MPQLHLLGTGAVVSDPERTTTMLAVQNDQSTLLVDSGGDVAPRMAALGLDPVSLSGLIVTHEHADHVAGFPLLLERIWLMGRRTPLPVYGIEPALAQVTRIHDAFDTADWPDYAGFTPHLIETSAGATVLEHGGWRVTAAPGTHAVPAIGLRFEDVATGRSLAYSGDTAPTDHIKTLAQGCDVLVHEASGEGPVHTSAAQAARLANEAGAGRLILVHVPARDVLAPDLAAATAIRGDTLVGEEITTYAW